MSDFDFPKLNRSLDRVKSKVFMGSASAFYAPLMSSLGFKWDEETETAATDYAHIYWSPQFFLDAPKKYQSEDFNLFVLQHELEHNARLHNLRQGNRCPDVWNYACDVRINNDLKLLNFNWGTFPAWYRPDFDVNGRLDEEAIYDLLIKQGFQVPLNPWGAGGDMLGDPTDNAAAQKSLNAVVRAITNAKMEGKPGAIPGNIEQIVDHFLAPIIPWEVELKKWHTDLADEDFTWSRPNRRYLGID